MASTSRRPHPARALIALVVLLLLLAGSLIAGHRWSDATLTPNLALDLEGGTQLILSPRTTDGSQVTPEDIEEAIGIIRQRVDASGVAEAEITSQGQNNIVVALPGQPSQETLDLVRTSAQLRFRPVLTYTQPGPIDMSQFDPETGQPVEPAEGEEAPAPDPAAIEAAALAAADMDGDGQLSTEPATEPESNSDLAWMTEQLTYDFYTMDCTNPDNLVGGGGDDPAQPMVSCANDGTAKYALGPVDMEGASVTQATSAPAVNEQGVQSGGWAVSLQMDGEGREIFRDISQRLVAQQEPQNQFAIVLDTLVISAPVMQSVITDGRAQITGNFTQEGANTLANQLNFGSLPLDFVVQSEQQISATLGAEQLQRGILAGVIGLILVVLYMTITYRGLSIVSLSSLAIAAVMTYLVITVLSWTIGYRLSLPGVVGLIVAVGITADSFIVYFERIRDELREGRTIDAAVEQGWVRARRTILASDAVNLLAAVVLYMLSVGGVRGFAFTLGLTTIIDVIVVFLFTHPIMKALARTRFYGQGKKLSGLEPESLGVDPSGYGTGRERLAMAATSAVRRKKRQKGADTGEEAAYEAQAEWDAEALNQPMTIAERRRAEQRAQKERIEAENAQAAKAYSGASTGTASDTAAHRSTGPEENR